MTTYIQFKPQPNTPFQFNLTLDSVAYVAIVTWNVYGQRYYVGIYNTSKTLIMLRPLIGSPPEYDINLVFNYFKTSTLVYRVSTNNFEVTP